MCISIYEKAASYRPLAELAYAIVNSRHYGVKRKYVCRSRSASEFLQASLFCVYNVYMRVRTCDSRVCTRMYTNAMCRLDVKHRKTHHAGWITDDVEVTVWGFGGGSASPFGESFFICDTICHILC